MVFTLIDANNNQKLFTNSLVVDDVIFTIRPLVDGDVDELTIFLEGLGSTTRKFYTYDDYNRNTAIELCKSIAKYDKFRLIVTLNDTSKIIGLMEFSLNIPQGDRKRYNEYGIKLMTTDCRFGPCLADDYQGRGIASKIFPYIIDTVKIFGRNRIILWGGVFAENIKAIRFYERIGFKYVGEFINSSGVKCIDMYYSTTQ